MDLSVPNGLTLGKNHARLWEDSTCEGPSVGRG